MKEHEKYNLILKYLKGEASKSEENTIKYLLKNEDFRQLFAQLSDIWKKSPSSESIHSEKFRILKELNSRINEYDNTKREQRTSRKRSDKVKPLLKIAAVILILIIPLSIYYTQRKTKNQIAQNQITKSTELGQKLTLTLSDGTKVKLNSGSKLIYPKVFDQKKREVVLEGEAFFEVTKDTERPFLIKTDNIITKVLGTSFNTKAFLDDQNIKISLVEGKVEVLDTKNGESQFLNPSEELIFNKISREKTKQPFDKQKVISWKDNILIFENETLEEIAVVLNKWYGVDIILKNESIKKCKLKARFENESLINVLNTIKYAGDYEYTFSKGVVQISGNGC
ncbi:FecR family protein [Aquimarina algiphila]|uniref:FecR family protein n=1 Tax=Aquimarina algiphila TaxID=2047982 RepID=UPI00248F9E86|nr:FecR family protein [Aquimarina algiphila]